MRSLGPVLMTLALFGCDPGSQRDPSLGPEADYSRYQAFAGEIRGAGTPVLYEGLPSDLNELEL